MTDWRDSGVAATRAADAMLQAMGGEAVTLVLPLVALPDDPSAQLGLVDPGVQQLTLSPAATRTLNAPNRELRKRMEFLISATAVGAAVVTQNAASADALFDSALGVLYDGELLRIQDVVAEYIAGTPYLYKVTAGA